MDFRSTTVLVAGGASGLGAACARAFHDRGAKVLVADLDAGGARSLADQLGDGATSRRMDVTDRRQVRDAVRSATSDSAPLRLTVVCAGIGHAERILSRNGAHSTEAFDKVIAVNFTGTFNLLREAAAEMAQNDPLENGERGVVILTASVAAFDGQAGQIAYAASKAAIAGMALPAARDLAPKGIRVCAIAPGTFETPLLMGLPERARELLAEQVPFPSRLGDPAEFAQLAAEIACNQMLNGEVIRLDGALRMPHG